MTTNYNLAGAIHRHGLHTPDAVAVAYKGQSVSYRELSQRAARLAQALRQSEHWQGDHGQPPRVGILASRGIDACVALLGTCWAGATYVPIGLKLPEERILSILSLCKLTAIVADADGAKLLSERLRAACPPLVIWTGTVNDQAIMPEETATVVPAAEPALSVSAGAPAAVAASDLAYIIFTSGTTGVPKGVMISAAAARHYAQMISRLLDLRASDRALETCELTFDFSVHNMFSTWEAGAALHILPATVVMNAVKFVRNAQLTVWNSVPSLVGMLRQLKTLHPGSLEDLRVTVFGGEALPEGSVAAWRVAAPNTAIFNLYGPTEATVFCLGQEVADDTAITAGRDFIAIGTPLPGNAAMIVDGNNQAVLGETPGELAVAGVQLADGYLNDPQMTAARFPTINGKRWYLTGDLASVDAAGVFHCLGRIDNQVKVLGYRVELEEIDAHLRAVSGIDLVAAVAWPTVDGMARGVVGFLGATAVDSVQVIKDLKARLPAYMVPNQLIAVETVPLNQSGKVDRQALRRLLDQDPA
jgi:D-alanine--poly(phosphoribitol) ligase subunit 1